MDIQFFDDEGEVVKKNFVVPPEIDLSAYNYKPKTSKTIPPLPKYELFGTIAFDAKKVDDMSYYPIIKKQHKSINKAQWYVF